MDTTYNSFDRLVAGLSSEERVSLLKRLESGINADTDSLIFETPEDNLRIVDLEREFKSESVFLRFWIFLKGLFSNTGIEGAYNEYRIGLALKKINNENPNLIDSRRLAFENLFYDYLIKLHAAAAFFKDGIAAYEKDEGGFYVFLTTLVMPRLAERMENEVSPYAIPFSAELTPELRSSLIRKMESILSDISPEEKVKLHDCFSCLDWLKRFVSLPFMHFISLFKTVPEKGKNCLISAAQSEIGQFAKVLCNAKKILPEVLEALYMFSIEEKMKESENIDIENTLAEFLHTGMQHIGFIKYFISSVPMCTIGAIAFNSALWIPEIKEISDSWFVRCKNEWRKIFDEKWTTWLHDRKIVETKDLTASMFKLPDYPFIPNRPWQAGKLSFSCKREYSMGFLYAFFSSFYPDFIPFLEIVLVDGKFIIPENRIEFTDTYNEMNHLAELIEAFNTKLAPAGIYGQAFAAVGNTQNFKEQEKVKNLMRSIESECNLFVTVFSGCCRSFKQLFDGMFVDVRNIKYDSLSNLASLTDENNVPIRSKLVEISQKIDQAFQLLKDIETMENEAP